MARLLDHEDGYRAVVRDLVRWHGTRTRGCVAFVATALRHVGYDVPDERADGPWSNPARVTFSLDRYLDQGRWARVDDPTALVAGDLVFTVGAPDHVMVFHEWADLDRAVAVVSDNQAHRYRRALRPAPGGAVSGFAFARRAPSDWPSSVDLDDDPVCQNATLLRRRAGSGYLTSPGAITCRRLTGAPGAVALVSKGGDTETPEELRLIVLDARRRLRAGADLRGAMDGNGAGTHPVLLGGGDLAGDGRVEVWLREEVYLPMGSETSTRIHLRQVRGGRLVEIRDDLAGWTAHDHDVDEMRAGGEHGYGADPARRISCLATITARRDDLVITRELRRGASVRADWPDRGRHLPCEPATVLEVRRAGEADAR